MDWFLLAFISALLSAAAALSQKKILFKLDALDFSFLVSIINLLFVIPFFLSVDYGKIEPDNLLILFLKTVLEAAAFLNVMLAIKNLEISKALPLLALTPGLVAIFAYIFIEDELSFTDVTAIALMLSGTYMMEVRKGQNIFDPFKILFSSKKYSYVLTAILIFTITSILDRTLLWIFKLEPSAFISFQHLFLAVIFLFIFTYKKRSGLRNVLPGESNIWILLILISALTIGYRYTQIEAIKIAPVALVLSVKRLSVFFASVTGGKIFKEEKLLIKAFAAAVIITGAILLAF